MELLTRPTLRPQPAVIESADAHRVAIVRCSLLAAMQARGIYHAVADEAVIALLADLKHFCGARRIDFAACLRIADRYFADETAGRAS